MARRKGERKITRGTATSTPDLTGLYKLEPSAEAKAHVPSDVDAMGQDKRRQVVGHAYGPSRKSQVIFFVAVGAILVFLVGGFFAAVAAFDQPADEYPDKAPWSQSLSDPADAAEQAAAPKVPSGPCGEPGNAYPIPADSPCSATGAETSNATAAENQPIAGAD